MVKKFKKLFSTLVTVLLVSSLIISDLDAVRATGGGGRSGGSRSGGGRMSGGSRGGSTRMSGASRGGSRSSVSRSGGFKSNRLQSGGNVHSGRTSHRSGSWNRNGHNYRSNRYGYRRGYGYGGYGYPYGYGYWGYPYGYWSDWWAPATIGLGLGLTAAALSDGGGDTNVYVNEPYDYQYDYQPDYSLPSVSTPISDDWSLQDSEILPDAIDYNLDLDDGSDYMDID